MFNLFSLDNLPIDCESLLQILSQCLNSGF